MDLLQAATHEKAVAEKDAVKVFLNAIVLKHAGIVVPIGVQDEEREEYLTTILGEADTRDGVICSSTWLCRPFEDILGATTRFIVLNGTEISPVIPPGTLKGTRFQSMRPDRLQWTKHATLSVATSLLTDPVWLSP